MNALPASNVATSFFLPKIVEQGFGVPVREIDGDYLPALRQRLDALLQHKTIQVEMMPNDRTMLQGLVPEVNPRVAAIMSAGGALLTNHELDRATSNVLLELLHLKEIYDLESLGLDFRYGRRIRIEKDDLPYLQLLYGLEHMGAIEGIVYNYDVWRSGGTPDRQDIRRIKLNADRVLDAPQALAKSEEEIVELLDRGLRIDADAGALRDFFVGAYKSQQLYEIRRLHFEARTFVTGYPRGRRYPVLATTIVEAR